MNRESTSKLHIRYMPLLAATALLAGHSTFGQVPVDESGNPVSAIDGESVYQDEAAYQDFDIEAVEELTPAELQELLGPVALYPDDLLAIVLPASTYPLEIVQAARFLEDLKTDSNLKPNEDWDESITALLNYPEVLEMMNEDIDWTWKLGEAVVRQQQDVIAAVENFRDRAYAAGNLKSDERQNVTRDEGVIEIVPIDEEIIYVPYYEPEHVLVSQVRPVYHYYPRAYPVYYYPYPYGHSFSSDYFWGVTTAFRIGWATDYLHVHHHSYWGHPYYGRSYFGNYYRRPTINVYNNYYVNNRVRYSANRYRDGDYWRPRTYGGARPGHYSSRTQSYRRTDIARPTATRVSNNRSVNNRVVTRTTGQRTTNRRDLTFRNRDHARSTSRQRSTTTRTTAAPSRTATSTPSQRTADRSELTFRSRGQARTVSSQRPTVSRPTVTQTTTTSASRNRPQTVTSNRVQHQAPVNRERRATPTPARESRQVSRRSDSSSNRSQSSQRATTSTRTESRNDARRQRRH